MTPVVFKEKLFKWEVGVSRYEQQGEEALSDSWKIAVLDRHAPPEFRAALRTHTSRGLALRTTG